MKYIKLFESFEDNYVGIHCSPQSLNDDDFYGKIIDEYYIHFDQILHAIKIDYKEANTYLEQIVALNDGLSEEDDEGIDLISEIEGFFDDNNIEWIFVSKGEALTKYGDNCYSVYFNDLDKVYHMDDELTENATIYIYNSKTDKPILKEYYV